MTRQDRARALRDQIKAACDAAGLDLVMVTVDPLEVAAGYTHGVVVVLPPRLEFTSWNETEETWTIHVAAGPWDNVLIAWDTIDLIIDAMRGGEVNLADGEPTPMLVADGEPPMPGYEITLVPDPIYDV